ncbi:SMC-Scp complex subunit ScpB [Rhodothalassium salexigens]|uniref:SMC-Scp complex subunit ScpB n=1 Tax=Rhodothalassium salexigens TaxID=1086 RepID=UPI0019119D9E|nr:SMC-Scp complex subunit ScpB [Rhodothalassium salexigens]MBK5920440.1 SMC-Scp complex subunit ScpB [Rhodothalassium salexigens]
MTDPSPDSEPPRSERPSSASPAATDPDAASERMETVRRCEALLFAAETPLSVADLAHRLGAGVDVAACLARLEADYADRGVNLVRVGGRWQFRTATDLAHLMRREVDETRKLSRAGVETLAIVAYHQPVTRAEIEDIRGVSISKGTLDVLLAAGWIKPRGRRQTPGRPLTYATTDAFLVDFGLDSLDALPGLADLKAAGLLDSVDAAFDRLDPTVATADGEADGDDDAADGGEDAEDADADENDQAASLKWPEPEPPAADGPAGAQDREGS